MQKGVRIKVSTGQMAFICSAICLYVGAILAAGLYVALTQSPLLRP